MDYETELEYEQFEGLVKGLIEDNYGTCDNFLLPSTVKGLSQNIVNLGETGNLRPAAIGNQLKVITDKSIRGDQINWIEPLSKDVFELVYLKKIEGFIQHLNRTCFTSISSYESHYAQYGKNTFYKRHLDQFKNENGRQFSVILYLNDEWKANDGGMLSMYPLNNPQVNIAPLGGRIVFFKSDEMEHEVHASTTRDRKSIAGWLKN